MNLGGGRLHEEPEINLIPLIDVILTLIIFFVVTTTFSARSALKLQLPEATLEAEATSREALTILVDADGRYFVGDNEVLKRDVASLRDAIAATVGGDRERPITLRADARTPHQAVVIAMDAVGQLGFEKLSIATKPQEHK